jgi:diketogulonate reductase-like aldo/keto reductase
VAAFEALKQQGKIREWGVSNLDVTDMEEVARAPGGDHCAANQVLYHPNSRGIEYDLLPWCQRHGVAVMAYSPLGHNTSRLLRSPALIGVAKRHGVTPAQVALAWGLRFPHVISIPKASDPDHVRENAAAADIVLNEQDLAEIDAAHPPPGRKQPLDLL